MDFNPCFKPAFNAEELPASGYENIWRYFSGQSMYNGSIYGWAGHTEDGKVVSTVEGEI